MAWYWIVLICVGYLFMSLVTAVIVRLLDITYEDELVVFLALFWPIACPVLIVIFIITAIDGISKEIVKKIEEKWESRKSA